MSRQNFLIDYFKKLTGTWHYWSDQPIETVDRLDTYCYQFPLGANWSYCYFKQCKFIRFTRFRLSRTFIFTILSLYGGDISKQMRWKLRKLIDFTVVNWRTVSVHDGFSLKEKRGNLLLESNGSIKLNLIICVNTSGNEKVSYRSYGEEFQHDFWID